MGWLRSLWDRIVDGAGEELGELEDDFHRRLYSVTPYARQVSADLWRGSWPTPAIFEILKAAGVRTVVNLCSEQPDDGAAAAGFVQVVIRVRDNTPPDLEQVEFFLEEVARFGPAYVHCEAGKGRTGCMVAAYRILSQGVKPEAALLEAEALGLAMPDQRAWILGLRPVPRAGEKG